MLEEVVTQHWRLQIRKILKLIPGIVLTLLPTLMIIAFNVIVGAQAPPAKEPTPTPLQAVGGKTFTVVDLKKLRWIEGTWRGAGDGVPPFFERYKFENESTLVVETLEGEHLEKVTDVTRFELKNGKFGGGNEGSLWEASSIDSKSINFAPVIKARNSFRFEQNSRDVWTATLSYPASADKPARERVYRMERWPKH